MTPLPSRPGRRKLMPSCSSTQPRQSRVVLKGASTQTEKAPPEPPTGKASQGKVVEQKPSNTLSLGAKLRFMSTHPPKPFVRRNLPTATWGGRMGLYLLSTLVLSGSTPFGNTFEVINRQPLRVFRSGLNWRGQWKLTDAAVLRAAHGCVGMVPEPAAPKST